MNQLDLEQGVALLEVLVASLLAGTFLMALLFLLIQTLNVQMAASERNQQLLEDWNAVQQLRDPNHHLRNFQVFEGGVRGERLKVLSEPTDWEVIDE